MSSNTEDAPPTAPPGQMSPLTGELRPHIDVPEEVQRHIRQLVRQGHKSDQIALKFGYPEAEIEKALCTMRTPHSHPARKSINFRLQEAIDILSEAKNGETQAQTVMRILEEARAARKH